MSLVWTKRVWASAVPADASARLLLLALADFADDAGLCWPSVPRLAARCAVTERALRYTLGRLVAAGLVSVERTSGRTNRYRLAVPSAAPTPEADCTPIPEARFRGERTTPEADFIPTPESVFPPPPAAHFRGPLQPVAAEASKNHPSKHQQNPREMDEARGETHGPTPPTVPGDRTLGAALAGLAAVAISGSRAAPGGDAAAAGMNGKGMPPSADAASTPVDEAAMVRAASLLTARGVDAVPALRLVRTHGAARVTAVVGRFDAEGGKSAGWLVAALERGYAAPSSGSSMRSGAGPSTGAPEEGSDLLTHAAALSALVVRGVVLDQLHPMTSYLDVVPQGDGTVRFRFKASAPPAPHRRGLP